MEKITIYVTREYTRCINSLKQSSNRVRITVHHEEAAKHAFVSGHKDYPSPTSSPIDEVVIDNCPRQARLILEYQELYNH
ncbi:hypothetical protein SADUNF_Sadunf08G0133200 [Salix dunnii]|uniref:Uncharacterized protein n=1 Tax=Salix dunnii TaxID=1413687 RepID=A0A835K2Y9_9ROSI|nr:hypothetical protein SADUNF_Sadunf08G0133200 [Salix dunnii]